MRGKVMGEDKEQKKREKGERKARAREEKARQKEEKQRARAERRERREREREDREEALEEMQELPEVAAEESAEELRCEPVFSPGKVEEGTLIPYECEEEPEERPPVEEEPLAILEEEGREADREGWFTRLRKGLSKSRMNFVAPLSRAMASRRFDDAFWEEVEEILLAADVGVEMTLTIVNMVRERMSRERVKEPEDLLALFRNVLAELLDTGEQYLTFATQGPSVFMVVGVNGTGKTTTIAKLGHVLKRDGKNVIFAAGDTFRAAGIEQLEAWGQRVGIHTVKHKQGADAAAVVHDAVESAVARDLEVVIVDTAGRLHTKINLMEELKKIRRIAEREAQVTETLLVIDATTGQNGVIQAKQFREAVEVTGVILTKLDGTAKGGIVVAIVHDLGIPIKFIGVGEGVDDLYPFDPQEFAAALFS
jgi:fused signal recognition particle receptor